MGALMSFHTPTNLHGAYHAVTRVPSGQAFVHYAALSFDPSRPLPLSSSHLIDDGLPLHKHMRPPLVVLPKILGSEGSLVGQCLRRLTTVDGSKEPSADSFWPASSQTRWSSMRVVMSGAFGARPPTRVTNSSPSQARFKESTPMI
jgi:hypothetical protein